MGGARLLADALIAALGRRVRRALYYLRPLPDLLAIMRAAGAQSLARSPRRPAVVLAGAAVVFVMFAPGRHLRAGQDGGPAGKTYRSATILLPLDAPSPLDGEGVSSVTPPQFW